MVLITCPGCEARDEVEFGDGGQAHVAYQILTVCRVGEQAPSDQ